MKDFLLNDLPWVIYVVILAAVLLGLFIKPWREGLVKANHAVHKVILWIGQISLVVMIIIVTMTVILRIFGTGLSWAEEVPRMLITLFVFIACAMGVRDHMHVSVSIVFNLFPKDGKVRKALIVLTDVAIFLCGTFMFISGWQRAAKQFTLTGSMPMTGISVAWQYVPIALGGLVVVIDSAMFICGLLKRDDYLYSDPDAESDDEIIERAREEMKEREVQA